MLLRVDRNSYASLPWDVGWVCDEFCDDTDGRYGGKLMFDNIFTDDEPQLLPLPSPSDDGESFTFDDVDAAFRCVIEMMREPI